jgi:hypothetical protein
MATCLRIFVSKSAKVIPLGGKHLLELQPITTATVGHHAVDLTLEYIEGHLSAQLLELREDQFAVDQALHSATPQGVDLGCLVVARQL